MVNFSPPESVCPKNHQEDPHLKSNVAKVLMYSVLLGAGVLFIGCVREPKLDLEKWLATNDSTLSPQQRSQLLSELIHEGEFIRARLSRAIDLLGQPDYIAGDTAVYTIFESVRSDDSLISLHLKFKVSDDSVIKSTYMVHAVKIIPDSQ